MRPLAPFRRLALGALLAALAVPSCARAQAVTVRAYVTPGPTVGVGRSFVLNLEIDGTQSLDRDPEVPDLGAFAQYLGSGSSTSMQVVNGRSSVSVTIQYRFQATREGTFDIPAIEVRTGGSAHRTDPIHLTVSASPPPATGGTGSTGGGRAAAGGEVSPDDLFVTAEASKARVLEGEPFVVEYRIWTHVDVTSYSFTSLPEPAGFLVQDLGPEGQPQIEQRTRNGTTYASAVIRRVALVPTGTGKKKLDPVGVQADVRVRRADDPFDRFFGGASLFGAPPVPTTVMSNPLEIDVVPLPPGRPQPFSGVVGSLEVSASLDRDSVAVNEAVTLTVRASGDGNIRSVPAPELQLPADFEVFPPDVSQSAAPDGRGPGGTKTFEYVLIPRAPGSREVPAISMGYYDLAAGRWGTATSTPIPLTVSGTAAAAPAPGARGSVAELREDIRFIHLGAPSLRRTGRPLFEGPGFWMFALLPMGAVAGALALRRHRDRLEGDVAYARGRRASRVARRRLAEARRLSTAEDPRPFYAEVARALRGFVADKLNVAEAGMQTAEMSTRLARASVDEGTAGEVVACLEHCDRMRFAPPAPDAGEKARFLARAGALMTTLDRRIRS